ncbi:hypothetical protein [Micromonospora sagamiensis]|uniref:Uncharacterized protein n=1 Tax=Micromonospora sagamiensis TaxID=47875 RepID=A0A562WJI3_9ACTN|nr:hypothetical protein [Micromonospora sagamiensis]TWJ30332.1 hypothetical protein JD81_03870 [Micromonospora sagamiensis]BCL16638.1 hypothetical protein GCM10017556_43770 [Micromonospora sagamiensis]
MRHIKTVIAALGVGPLAWFLLAAGQGRSLRVFGEAQESGGALDPDALLKPLLVLAAAGLLLGLVATVRISPLGSVLTGLAYSASYVGLLFSPARLLDLLGHKLSVAGYQIDLLVPVRTGTSVLLGSLLLVGVASVQRWRRWPQPDAAEPAVVVPDTVIPPVPERDRPLGAEGLRPLGAEGLRPLGAEGLRPLGADGLGSTKQAEDPTKPGRADETDPALVGGSPWPDSPHSDSTNEPWQSGFPATHRRPRR